MECPCGGSTKTAKVVVSVTDSKKIDLHYSACGGCGRNDFNEQLKKLKEAHNGPLV